MGSLKGHISDIISELKHIQEDPGFPGPADGFPGLIDAGEHGSLLVNAVIERSIVSVSDLLLRSDPEAARQFTNAEWRALVRRAFGLPLAEIDLDDPDAADAVRKAVRRSIGEARKNHGDRDYAVGCSLFANDRIEPIEIGPVKIEARKLWLARMLSEGKINKVMARRICRIWSGQKVAKRKNVVEKLRERDILSAVGQCAFVCSVKTTGLPRESGKLKALTAARMAMAGISLAWARPSAALNGFRLKLDQNITELRVLTFEPGMIMIAGSKLSHPRSGHEFKPGEWEQQAERLALPFAAVGEVLGFVTHATGKVARPVLCNVLMQALLWFHEACREAIDAMAVVKFVAALDALAGGNGERAIRSMLRARVGWKDEDRIFKNGDLTMKQAVTRIYGEGRSRTIHGTSERLSNDFSEMRGLAEILARLALVCCLSWTASNPGLDDPESLQVS